MKEINESENNPLKKEQKENNNIEFFLKEKKEIKKNMKTKEENDNIKIPKNMYEKQEDEHLKKLFYQQRHLYEHKKDKKDPLINIYSPHLQEEYINEVNYIWRNSIISIIISILIISQNYLIHKNYKLYTEIVFCFFLSFFSIFLSSLLMIELYRNALRDQLRYKLFRLFSSLLFLTLICLIAFQISNSYTIYEKIKQRNEKSNKNRRNNDLLMNLFDINNINNIIIILGYFIIIGIILLSKFVFWLGFTNIKKLFGDLEVFQKQILEDQKENKVNGNKNIKENTNKEVHQKQN